jgi:hypothetical protein
MIPRKEKTALTEMKPSCRRARKYRSDNSHSKGAKGWTLVDAVMAVPPTEGE